MALLARSQGNAMTLRSDFMVSSLPLPFPSPLLPPPSSLHPPPPHFLHITASFLLAQNHLSGSDTCEVRGRTYKLRIELFQGQALTSLTSADFVPQGATPPPHLALMQPHS